MGTHGTSPIDPGRVIDWGKTSHEYALYRPGPPDRFYDLLRTLGVGLSGQRILDLGTGTGVLARRFAASGACVAGIDVSPEQLRMARSLADTDGVEVDWRVAAAEALPFPDAEFDVLTANQCWLYFDPDRATAEVHRVLKPGGVLVTSHFSWLPRVDPVARATEALVLQHNPAWSASDFSGEIPTAPAWTAGRFDVRAGFYFDEDVPFTIDTWSGRIRACRGVGATLSPDEVQRFDQAHRRMLLELAGERFTVRHRTDAHLLSPMRS